MRTLRFCYFAEFCAIALWPPLNIGCSLLAQKCGRAKESVSAHHCLYCSYELNT